MNKLLSLFHRSHRPDSRDLSAYLDGALSSARAASLEAHFGMCPACRSRLSELREVRSTLSALPDVDAPRSFRLHPSQVVRERQPARTRSFIYTVPALGAAAAVALVLLIAVDVSRGGTSNDSSGLTAFNAQRAPGDASAVAGTAAASSADRAAGAPAVPAPPTPDAEKSLQQNTAGATEFAPAAAPRAPGVLTPPAADQTLADSSVDGAASPTVASDALRIVPPARTDVPLTAADLATASSRTPAAVVTREEPSSSGGGGVGALRIGEIIAGVVIVVMGGLTVRMLGTNRRKA